MRRAWIRRTALTAAAALALAGCADGVDDDASAPDEPGEEQATGDELDLDDLDEDALEELLGGGGDLPDPNEDVVDGTYRGLGVVLPVPEGWSLDETAFAQGALAAFPEDGEQQLSALALDAEAIAAGGQPADLDALLDGLRAQVGQDADVDEEISIDGAERAHRLTYLDLPAQVEGGEASSITIVLAEDGDGLIGEFVLAAATADYDTDIETTVIDGIGFDPDSEPAPQPVPAPAP